MSLSNLQIGIWNVIGFSSFIPQGGTHFYCDPLNGSDYNNGTKETPFATLYRTHAAMTAGKNDVCHLISNGDTTSTARLSLALALTVDPTATTGTLTWSKNACHLLGEAAPFCATNRARIAPVATDIETTFNSLKLVNVTAVDCVFANIEAYHGFATGAAGQICWTDNGRNTYLGVVLSGMGDAASAASAASRSLVCNGSVGESTFYGCEIGLDTVARTAANASIEFAGGTPRNKFIDCILPFYVTGGGTAALAFITSAASAMDRWQLIERCKFINSSKSGAGTNAAYLATLAASSGGLLLFKDATLVGFTGYGTDATSRGQIYIDGGAPAAATTGLAVAPTA